MRKLLVLKEEVEVLELCHSDSNFISLEHPLCLERYCLHFLVIEFYLEI